jgi:hypothetical protein
MENLSWGQKLGMGIGTVALLGASIYYYTKKNENENVLEGVKLPVVEPKIFQQFDLSIQNLQQIIEYFHQEMDAGLAGKSKFELSTFFVNSSRIILKNATFLCEQTNWTGKGRNSPAARY